MTFVFILIGIGLAAAGLFLSLEVLPAVIAQDELGGDDYED